MPIHDEESCWNQATWFIKLGMFVSLVTWKCNLIWSYKMPALFPDSGSSLEAGKGWTFLVEPLQGWVSGHSYASSCLSQRRRWESGVVGTPKLTLLLMEWRHTTKVQVELCEPPCLERKFLSSATVCWLLRHADTVVYWSYKHHLWKDCIKTYCYFGGVLKSKWFCWTSLQHDSTNACVVTMKVAVNYSISIGMNYL